MTDKQIIIDGVDVHWCEHYTGNIGYLTDKNWTCRAKIQGTKCEDWSNCYFKRWQRKEQECDMWKNLTVDNGAVALKYQQQIDQLKEQLEAYKMEADEGKEINAELKAENKKIEQCIIEQNRLVVGMTKEIETLTFKKYELLQTLTEIKEICNNNDELKGDFNLVDCDKYKLGKHNLANKILQKISEVENE